MPSTVLNLGSGPYLVTVQHTGTRELARQLGVDLNNPLPAQGVYHVQHFMHMPDRTRHLKVYSPTRDPVTVLRSWRKRYGDNPNVMAKLWEQLGYMELMEQQYDVTHIPVDWPERAKALGVIHNLEFSEWQQTGHLPSPRSPTVSIVAEHEDALVALMKKCNMFRVYR